MTKTEQQWHKRQQVGVGQRRALIITSIVALLLIVVLSGCRIGDRFWVSGNPAVVTGPGQFTELAGTHVDTEPITAMDRTCALIYCPGWNMPKQYYWHQHIYHDQMGGPTGYWVVTVGEWHLYEVCTWWPNNSCYDPIAVAGARG